MIENKKYCQPEVVILGAAADLVQGDKVGAGESGLEDLLLVEVD